jgi:hypothetical protein
MKYIGAMLNKPVEEGSPPDIRGSIMLAMAESKEEVVAKLKEDVYVKVCILCHVLKIDPCSILFSLSCK